MTICYFSAQYLPTVGGVERYTWNLARCTVAAGHRAIVVTSALPNLPEHEIDGDGIEIYRLPVWPVMNGRFPVIKPGARFHALTAQIWAQSSISAWCRPACTPKASGLPARPSAAVSPCWLLTIPPDTCRWAVACWGLRAAV